MLEGDGITLQKDIIFGPGYVTNGSVCIPVVLGRTNTYLDTLAGKEDLVIEYKIYQLSCRILGTLFAKQPSKNKFLPDYPTA